MVYDFAIFGGGVVGCCLLNKLTSLGKKVVLLEKGLDVGVGQSKANSGIVHAGYDAKENSLKAKLNVRGNQLFDEYCKRLKVKIKNCGSLVVSESLDVLNELKQRGEKNGVSGLEIIERCEIEKFAPKLKQKFKHALFAKTAKVVSPYMFTIALAEEAVLNGATILFDFNSVKIEKADCQYIIESKKKQIVYAKKIINCAGFGVNEISSLLGVEQFDLTFRKGEYFVLDSTCADLVSTVVFPTPTKFGKGILMTITVDGNILLGPNNEKTKDYNTATTKNGLEEIKQQINDMYDFNLWDKVIRNYTGVRVSCGDDFIIEKSKIDEDVVLIAGINSPGLSSSPAIAEYVCSNLLGLEEKSIKMKQRFDYENFKSLSLGEKNKKIKQNPLYGKVVCKCENISEGEILDAINSPLKPRTLDGIKRRIRAGMGRCQSGFCMLKVMSLIAKQNNISLEKVEKENQSSKIVFGDFEYDVWCCCYWWWLIWNVGSN